MRTTFSLLIIGLLALGISACTAIQPATPSDGTTPAASSEATGSTSGMDHGSMDSETPFDAMFIDSMMPHHQGAVDMAEMALENAEHEEIRTMAQQIIDSQQAEIEQMQTWRSEWYPDMEATSGMDMEMGEMTMSEDASIPFDQRFMEAMIPHHESAIDMAEMALESAEHEEVRTMAQQIIDSQQAEIEQMQGWLSEWYGVN